MQIKKETFANLLNKRKVLDRCDEQKKCDPQCDKYVCVECGFVGCSRNSDNQCSLKHYESSKHKVVVSLTNQLIWYCALHTHDQPSYRCYECDDDLDSMIESVEEHDRRAKPMRDFVDMVRQQLYTLRNKLKTSAAVVPPPSKEQPKATQQLSYVPMKVFGLKNLGNTCFFNSVMQCLNGVSPLVDYYVQNRSEFTSKQVAQWD